MSPPASSPPPQSPTSPSTPRRARASTTSSLAASVRSATESVLDKSPPPGFIAATAEATSQAPTVGDIRNSGGRVRGNSNSDSDGNARKRSRSLSQSKRNGRLSRGSKEVETTREGLEPFPALTEEESASREEAFPEESALEEWSGGSGSANGSGSSAWASKEKNSQNLSSSVTASAAEFGPSHYANGYVPPPKLPWTTSTVIALKAFWRYFLTPFGFLVTIYGLNVVAWGGMLFLLLIGAAPAMCWANDDEQGWVYDCNHIDSARRIWIEVDSQILNALFCVTGLGLIPWRFRDLYFILSYRFTSEQKHGRVKRVKGLRRLAGHYRTWFRLPGSDTLDQMSAREYAEKQGTEYPAGPDTYELHCGSDGLEMRGVELESGGMGDVRVPIPFSKQPDEPPTGIRASPTKIWKLEFFVWCQVWNTFFQICLCGFMWGMSRQDRPAWSTGLFIALACGIVGIGGIVSFLEGKRIKKVEGIPPRPET